MAIACGLTAFVKFTDVSLLALMLFIQNTCISVQDISVDALAVAVLSVEDVGLGNVAQVVGFKFGGVAAGKECTLPDCVCVCLACLYCVYMFLSSHVFFYICQYCVSVCVHVSLLGVQSLYVSIIPCISLHICIRQDVCVCLCACICVCPCRSLHLQTFFCLPLFEDCLSEPNLVSSCMSTSICFCAISYFYVFVFFFVYHYLRV